nr:zinc-dependent peptidase [Haliscomenobacter sp.]
MHDNKLIAIAFFLLLLIACWWWLFFKKKRPKTTTFPTPWRSILTKKVAFYMELSAPEKLRFEESVLQFFDKVRITGIDTDLNDTDKLLVAASAVIPLFGFPGWRYRNLREVLATLGHSTMTTRLSRAKRAISWAWSAAVA